MDGAPTTALAGQGWATRHPHLWEFKGGAPGPFIGAKRRPLTATAAEGTRRQPRREADSASILCFQHVNAAATHGYSRSNRQPLIFLLADLFSTCLQA